MPGPADGIRKNFNLYVDGIGYAGSIDEFTPPALNITEEDYRAGGLDAPIGLDMGMEKLSCSFMLSRIAAEALRTWGVTGQTFALIVRGAVQNLDGSVKQEVFTMRGTIPGLEFESLKGAGGKSGYTMTMSPRIYTYTLDGVEIHHIDVPNMIRRINGVDQLAKIRGAIGI